MSSRTDDGAHADDEVIPGPSTGVDHDLPESEASLSDLLSRLIEDLTLLLRQEVELAKTELRRDFTAAGKAGGMLAAGVVLGFVALLLLTWAAAWGLAAIMPTGLAFLIVGVVVGAVAAGVAVGGRKRLQSIDPVPHETVDSLQMDKQTITERTPR